jgi:hypothetical protein
MNEQINQNISLSKANEIEAFFGEIKNNFKQLYPDKAMLIDNLPNDIFLENDSNEEVDLKIEVLNNFITNIASDYFKIDDSNEIILYKVKIINDLLMTLFEDHENPWELSNKILVKTKNYLKTINDNPEDVIDFFPDNFYLDNETDETIKFKNKIFEQYISIALGYEAVANRSIIMKNLFPHLKKVLKEIDEEKYQFLDNLPFNFFNDNDSPNEFADKIKIFVNLISPDNKDFFKNNDSPEIVNAKIKILKKVEINKDIERRDLIEQLKVKLSKFIKSFPQEDINQFDLFFNDIVNERDKLEVVKFKNNIMDDFLIIFENKNLNYIEMINKFFDLILNHIKIFDLNKFNSIQRLISKIPQTSSDTDKMKEKFTIINDIILENNSKTSIYNNLYDKIRIENNA